MQIDAVPLLGRDRTSHVMGSRLCLAAVNTVYWRRSAEPEEHLADIADLIDLVDGAGWLTDRAALEARAARDPRGAARAVAHARDVRESLLEVFAAVAAADAPPQEALAAVQDEAALGLAALRLIQHRDGYALGWPDATLDLPARQLATSAVLLLSSAELDRVKQCPGPTCGWVFLDSSRNRSRVWCSSQECGNRHRAQEHYRRSRTPVTG